MKILGIGVDIVENRRIQKSIKNPSFKKRIYTSNELKQSYTVNNKVGYFSKRYAAKEACAKALGTGLARGVFWKDIEVQNDKFGKPKIKLHNNALKFLKKITKSNDSLIEVSLSDEKKYAIANVIIYAKEKR